MSIFDVQHQDRAHRILQRALAAGRIPHAYIFTGPEGVGREMLAARFAKLLLCPNQTPSPVDPDDASNGPANRQVDSCGACESCNLCDAGTHPDLHLIQRELIRQHPDAQVRARTGIDLGIDVIREFVIKPEGLKAAMGHGKVFVIREADRMTTAAQNALLKTLEEPPQQTHIILVAVTPESLLATIRSRCQWVTFGLLPTSFIEQQLIEHDESISPQLARFYATRSAGSLGVAFRYHHDDLAAHDETLGPILADLHRASVTQLSRRMIDDAKELSEAYKQRDPDISDTEANRRALKAIMALAAMRYRDALHRSVQTLADACTDRSWRGPADSVRALVAAERQLDLNANVQLCIEVLLIKLARLAKRYGTPT